MESPSTSPDAPRPPLARTVDDRLIAGVCGGLARHLGLPVAWVRVGMAIAVLAGGAGGFFYLFLLVTMPEEGESAEVAPLRRVFTKAAHQPDASGHDAAVPGAEMYNARMPSAGKSSAGMSSAGMSGNETHLTETHGTDETLATSTSTNTNDAADTGTTARRPWPIAEILFGGVFLIAGGALFLRQFGVQLRLEVILPGLAVLVGVGLTWWLIADRARPERLQIPRILGALALVAVGVLMFFVTAEEPSVLTVIGAALAVLAGVALAITPWLLQLNRQLVAERAGRAREAERAEIAAHLHDSVLQTLALIQQRSEPASEVARLARGQERELREWLFRSADGGSAPERETAEAEISSHAATLEAQHPVRFEVVVVGERIIAPDAIISAAKEAMLNAARHAGGEVTVYLETTPDVVRIEVNDRGPGFDPDEIEGERLGVRESIFGRMERAGGSARIAPGPGGTGASVRLEQARPQVHDARDRTEEPS